jgi:sigma-E factor negative regulatory protein RseB
MTMRRPQLILATCAALGALLASELSATAEDLGPHDWLTRMVDAVQTTDYEGTVIRLRNGVVDALKVVHVVSDGVVREKVIVQEGNGLEIIRNGNEVQCILPDKKSVLIEEWNDQSTLFSTLPSNDIRFGSEYDVSIVREERVAGRKAVLLAIRPHDSFRFGHRIWLDIETGFPLKTTLVGAQGEAIEQVRFADISIGHNIQASALAPSIDIESFSWFSSKKRSINKAAETEWSNDSLPPGFRVVSTSKENVPGQQEPLVHIMYSDGLANVSVFIEPLKNKNPTRSSRVGSSNSFSIQSGDYQVTAVGEVPADTVQNIATFMHRN